MNDLEEHPVIADTDTRGLLHEQVHILDVHALTARARSLGVEAPDERPEWYVVLRYDSDFNERGLFWVGPEDE